MPVHQKALMCHWRDIREDTHFRIHRFSPYDDGDAKPDWSRDFSTCRYQHVPIMGMRYSTTIIVSNRRAT